MHTAVENRHSVYDNLNPDLRYSHAKSTWVSEIRSPRVPLT